MLAVFGIPRSRLSQEINSPRADLSKFRWHWNLLLASMLLPPSFLPWHDVHRQAWAAHWAAHGAKPSKISTPQWRTCAASIIMLLRQVSLLLQHHHRGDTTAGAATSTSTCTSASASDECVQNCNCSDVHCGR